MVHLLHRLYGVDAPKYSNLQVETVNCTFQNKTTNDRHFTARIDTKIQIKTHKKRN